jgi:hypothetical protein
VLANYGNLNLESALDNYREGIPVIVRAADGGVLHGEETLKAIVDTGVSVECAASTELTARNLNLPTGQKFWKSLV